MFVFTLVLLSILKIRFPANRPISRIISERYGTPTLKCFRQLESSQRKLDKIKCDLDFLTACYHYECVPKFLRIRLYKRHLEKSDLCRSLQRKLLDNEIRTKRREVTTRENMVKENETKLKQLVSNIDFSCIRLWIHRKQRNIVRDTRLVHKRKLDRLGISPIDNFLDSKTVITNLSKRNLTKSETKILLLGLEFALPILRLNFEKYFLDFEKLFYTFKNQQIYENKYVNANFFKNQLRSIARKYFYNFKPHKNRSPIFSKQDFLDLNNLAKDDTIHVTKPDKGRGVVILDKEDYIQKVNTILNDPTKFEKQQYIDKQKLIIKLEDKVNRYLRTLKKQGTITEEFYDNTFTSGAALGTLYGLPKIHKQNVPVRPIVSACNTHNFKLSKRLVPIIEKFSINEYTLKNSYDFVNSVQSIPNANSLYMCSLDVESLYTNVPLDDSINILLDNMFPDPSINYKGFSRKDFKGLLQRSLNDSFFTFNNNIYKQKDGLAMGSPLSPVIANTFLKDFEEKHLESCPINFKPIFYRRYLDDTFILFKCKADSELFYQYFNSRHPQVKFTLEGEENNKISFLDSIVTRSNNGFSTSVFRKKTFTGMATNFFSNIYFKYKISAITTLLYRAYKISSSPELLDLELNFLKSYFYNNNYPLKLININIRKFFNKINSIVTPITTVPKNKIYIRLPFIGNQTAKMKSEILSLLHRCFPQTNPCIYFQKSRTIASFFKTKDVPDVWGRSGVVYNYICDCCQQVYIGSTCVQMFVRGPQHQGHSYRTKLPLKVKQHSSIRDHCDSSHHPFKLSNFSIIDSSHGPQFDLRILESIHITSKQPKLNDMQSAIPLHITL